MRMIMHVSFPVESFNKAIRDGSIAGTMQAILAEQKPEPSTLRSGTDSGRGFWWWM